jgi:hypothetical protein
MELPATVLTEDQYYELEQACLELDEDSAVYPHYSGRAMYGEECVGIRSYDIDQLLYRLGWWLGGTDLGDILADLRISKDNMGLGKIAYFKNMKAPEGVEE